MRGLDALHGEIEEDLQRIIGNCAPIRYVDFWVSCSTNTWRGGGSNSLVTRRR